MPIRNTARILVYFIISCLSIKAAGQTEPPSAPLVEDASAKKKPAIDKYWFVILKTGPKTDADSATKKSLFEGHMQNMDKLYRAGVLKAAGPFGKNEFKWRGIFVLDCATREEAEQYVQTDPAVAAGIFVADIAEWYTEASGNFKHGIPEKE